MRNQSWWRAPLRAGTVTKATSCDTSSFTVSPSRCWLDFWFCCKPTHSPGLLCGNFLRPLLLPSLHGLSFRHCASAPLRPLRNSPVGSLFSLLPQKSVSLVTARHRRARCDPGATSALLCGNLCDLSG